MRTVSDHRSPPSPSHQPLIERDHCPPPCPLLFLSPATMHFIALPPQFYSPPTIPCYHAKLSVHHHRGIHIGFSWNKPPVQCLFLLSVKTKSKNRSTSFCTDITALGFSLMEHGLQRTVKKERIYIL